MRKINQFQVLDNGMIVAVTEDGSLWRGNGLENLTPHDPHCESHNIVWTLLNSPPSQAPGPKKLPEGLVAGKNADVSRFVPEVSRFVPEPQLPSVEEQHDAPRKTPREQSRD